MIRITIEDRVLKGFYASAELDFELDLLLLGMIRVSENKMMIA